MATKQTASHLVCDEAGYDFHIAEYRAVTQHTDLASGRTQEVFGPPAFELATKDGSRSVIDMHGSDEYDCPPRTVFRDETGKLYLLKSAIE